MTKYSEEFKFKIVQAYLKSAFSYDRLAQKYGIPSSTPVKHWVKAYKAFGVKGLQRKIGNKEYPVQFKLDVLHFIKQTGASYQETAVQFKVNNPSLIASWNSKLLKEGIEGLQEKVKGRPSMSKNQIQQRVNKKKKCHANSS